MALYEYYCDRCRHQFEQLTSRGDPDAGKCPKCQTNNTRKLISAFRVGGRGDLRESTMHGCHDAHVPAGEEGHSSHDHGSGHDLGHVHGPGCGHGGGGHSHDE